MVDSLGLLGPSRHLGVPFVDTNCMFLRRDIAPLVRRPPPLPLVVIARLYHALTERMSPSSEKALHSTGFLRLLLLASAASIAPTAQAT